MRVLVIGSEGNLGRPLAARLRESGHEVLCADWQPGCRPDYHVADITHPLDLLDAFDWRPEAVYLLAGMVSRVTCEQAAGLAVEANLAGVNNVAQLCKRGRAKLIHFSTSEVYGPIPGEMREDGEVRPNNRYGLTNLLAEHLVQYEVRDGLRASVLRPFMIYGEHETRGDHRSAIIRIAAGLAAGRPVRVHLGCSRGWLHVDDAARAFEAALALPGRGETLNIGHPDVRPMDQVAKLIRKELGAPKELLEYGIQPPRMTRHKLPALRRQRDLLGFEPAIGLEEGIRRVCAAVRA
jgi:nucleoside-diphosphate-sugar epimerase